jgi:hypothetical protein
MHIPNLKCLCGAKVGSAQPNHPCTNDGHCMSNDIDRHSKELLHLENMKFNLKLIWNLKFAPQGKQKNRHVLHNLNVG